MRNDSILSSVVVMPVPEIDLTPDTLDLIPDDARGCRTAGFSAEEVKDLGHAAAECRGAGYHIAECRRAGLVVGTADCRAAAYTALECKRAGYSCWECAWAGYSASEIRAAGYSSSSCRETRVITSAADARRAGFDAEAARAARFTAAECKAAEYSPLECLLAGFSARELWPLCGPDLCAEIVRFYNMGERVLCEGKSGRLSHRSADGSRVQIRFEDGSVNTDNAGDGDLALSKGIKVRPLEWWPVAPPI